MSNLPELRASDADRERIALELRDQAVAGRLTLDELSERLEVAYTVRTASELEPLTADLPSTAPSRAPATHWTVVAFGNVERKGRWRLPRRSRALVGFGNVDFDLRQAELQSDVASITAFLLFGNVDVYVPEGVEVDVGGFLLFGHRRDWGKGRPRPGSPQVRVRVFALFGTADVWRVPRALAGMGLREVIRTMRRGS